MYAIINDKKIELKKANNFHKKLFGLLFKKNSDYGIFLNNCNAIHTFFMKKNIHVVFLNQQKEVLKICSNIKPNQICFCKGAEYVIEIPINVIVNEIKTIEIIQ